jgi:hypothetical protein
MSANPNHAGSHGELHACERELQLCDTSARAI